MAQRDGQDPLRRGVKAERAFRGLDCARPAPVRRVDDARHRRIGRRGLGGRGERAGGQQSGPAGQSYALYFLLHLDSPDYTLQGEMGTILYTFSPNVSRQCTTIQTLEDNISEPPETLSLRVLLPDEMINLSPAATNVTIIRK